MIELNDQIRDDVNGSLMSGHPMVFCAVTPEGLPTVSFRGSVTARGADALAIWVRNPDKSTLLAAIAERPTVVVMYSKLSEFRFYKFTGHASVVQDEDVRREIFDAGPELERKQDPERTGAAVLIELDQVEGRGSDGLFRMTRD